MAKEVKETKQKRLFQKTRAGEVLSKEQVKYIKAERKKLRKQMKKMGIKSRREFELTASSMGLYFDKHLRLGLLWWLLRGKALWWLLGALATLLFLFYIMSLISQQKGHFTINLTDDMFRNGFVISETEDFADPVFQLFSHEVTEVPCISIVSLPEDIEDWEGTHDSSNYFAYTFWVRNEGQDTVDYTYDILINSESQNLSEATWIMLFENGKMTFHAKESAEGGEEAIPSFSDRSQGYRITPFINQAKYPDEQYQVVAQSDRRTYYRAVPIPFVSEAVAVTGRYDRIAPMETVKYTVVMWLEGDDPDCTDELIGGHLGIEMQFHLVEDASIVQNEGFASDLKRLADAVKDALFFWKK